jgi:nitrogen regulatory protein PII
MSDTKSNLNTNIALIVTVVRKGWGDTVLEASIGAGAHGGTVMFGRGTGIHERQTILGISIEPEKEIVLTLTYENQVDAILQAVVSAADLDAPGNGLAFVVQVEKVAGVPHTLWQAGGNAGRGPDASS